MKRLAWVFKDGYLSMGVGIPVILWGIVYALRHDSQWWWIGLLDILCGGFAFVMGFRLWRLNRKIRRLEEQIRQADKLMEQEARGIRHF